MSSVVDNLLANAGRSPIVNELYWSDPRNRHTALNMGPAPYRGSTYGAAGLFGDIGDAVGQAGMMAGQPEAAIAPVIGGLLDHLFGSTGQFGASGCYGSPYGSVGQFGAAGGYGMPYGSVGQFGATGQFGAAGFFDDLGSMIKSGARQLLPHAAPMLARGLQMALPHAAQAFARATGHEIPPHVLEATNRVVANVTPKIVAAINKKLGTQRKSSKVSKKRAPLKKAMQVKLRAAKSRGKPAKSKKIRWP